MTRRLKETYHKIGEILVRRKAASPEAIDEALALQRAEIEQGKSPPRLGEILIERKVLDRLTIREILEEQKIGRGEKQRLRITLRDSNGVAVVGLEGRLDQSKEQAVTRIFEKLMNRGFARVAVDGSRLLYLNSYGVSSFIAYIDESRARGGDVKFFKLNTDSKMVLHRMGLFKFVQCFNSEEDAIQAFDIPIDEYMSRGALGEYISASNSRTFHLSYCIQAQAVPEDSRIYYESKWHAREESKSPCRKCKP